MSFYGSISDRSRTDLKFDKIYPNRYSMDLNAEVDDIFVGRYVLVNYEDGYKAFVPDTTKKEDGYYQDYLKNEYTDFYCIEKNKGTCSFLSDFVFTNAGNGNIEGSYQAKELQAINKDLIFKVQPGRHLYNFNEEPFYAAIRVLSKYDIELLYISSFEEYERYWNAQSNAPEEAARPHVKIENEQAYLVIQNDTWIQRVYSRLNSGIGEETGIVYVKIGSYHKYTTSQNEEIWIWPKNKRAILAGELSSEDNLTEKEIINFNIDHTIYGTDRGYNSTVWEKIYISGHYKYIKIAELNAYVPSFDLRVNAPTSTPKTPQISTVGDNINYNIDWQPSWGLRVKSAVPNLKIPKMDTSGEILEGTTFASDNSRSSIWEDKFNSDTGLKSDMTTRWETEIFNEDTKSYEKYLFSRQGANGEWKKRSSVTTGDRSVDIPAAVYFNQEGFNPYHTHYSNNGSTYPGLADSYEYMSQNFIKVENTGNSGKLYDFNGIEDVYPDTQELSIMLPVLGDSVSHMWDMLYGNGMRNFDTSWRDGTYVDSIRHGIRMVGYNDHYNKDGLSSLAGCINTAHDIIGMIVCDSQNVDLRELNEIKDGIKPDLSGYGENFIYYNRADQNYYLKQPYTRLEPVDNVQIENTDQMFVKVPLKAPVLGGNGTTEEEDVPVVPFEENKGTKKYYFKEKSNKEGVFNYIFSNLYYPDKEYVEIGSIQKVEEPPSRYVKDKYYNAINENYSVATGDYDDNIEYYDIDFEEISPANEKYPYDGVYVPGLYYYEIPIYKNGVKVGSNYVQDTSQTGFKYTETNLPGYYDVSSLPLDYTQNYVNKPTRYYLPEIKEEGNTHVKSEVYTPLNAAYSTKDHDYLIGLLYTKNSYGEYVEVTKPIAGTTGYYVKQEAVNDSEIVSIDTSVSYLLMPYDNTKIFYTEEDNDTFFKHASIPEIRDFVKGNGKRETSAGIEVLGQFYFKDGENTETPVYLYSGDNLPDYYIRLTETAEFPGSYILNTNVDLMTTDEYYVLKNIKPVNILTPYDYYKQEEITKEVEEINLETGEPEIVQKTEFIYVPITENDDLSQMDYIYKRNQYVVVSDSNNVYAPGTYWNYTIPVEDIPSGLVLGYAVQDYHMVPLEGFAKNLNTMLGLIVKINQLINDKDPNTRDRQTIQGILNYMNDIINKIDELYPNELIFTDQFGRIHAPKNSVVGDQYISLNIKDNQLQVKHKDPVQCEYNSELNKWVPVIEEEAAIHDEVLPAEELFNYIDEYVYDDNGEEIGITHIEKDFIEFEVPVIIMDPKGHICAIQRQPYKIRCVEFANSAVTLLEKRITALERNALRTYDEGITESEALDEDIL